MNYLFYDYETSGRSEKFDQVFQFAAIETDENFNQLSQPIEFFCRPRRDVLPSPHAIKVNQIDISELNSKGLSEFEFSKKVADTLTGSGNQCIVGYNSKNFDNEFTRYLLYRNFQDPYAWSYLNGNSCLDIFDIICLGYSIDRLIDIQVNSGDGNDSLKLENLARWNGLDHDDAHNAVSDVYATIQLAKLVNERCPKLFKHALSLRNVNTTREIVNAQTGFFRSSVFNGYERRFLSLHTRICDHPTINNSVICWNLLNDPLPILDLGAEEIRRQMYSKKEYRTIGVGFDSLRLNKSPMVVSFSEAEKNLVAEHGTCLRNLESVQRNMNSLTVLARDVFTSIMPEVDPDADLYAGDYFGETRMDAAMCNAVRSDPLTVNDLAFRSIRLHRLFRRLKARNFFDQLTDPERDQFLSYCSEKFACADNSPWLTKSVFDREMKEVLADINLSKRQKECLTVLGNYADEVAPSPGKMETEL